jgi:AcrR family transcriptional regulator
MVEVAGQAEQVTGEAEQVARVPRPAMSRVEQAAESTARRARTLTRERVLQGALELADEIGIEAFTMRRLAAALGVKPMTIYHHVSSKEQILDGIVDMVFAEITLPPDDQPWATAMRVRCHSAREVLARHPWATPLMETRTTPGPATLRHHDAVIGCLRRGGLSLELTAHAYAVIDSYVYGFALQEASLPFREEEEIAGLAREIMNAFPDGVYPHFAEFTAEHVLRPGYSFTASFDVGLDLLLDGIERMSAGAEADGPRRRELDRQR